MIKTTYIYYLHRGNNTPFYIGKTINPESRIFNHMDTYGKCYLEVIDEVDSDDWVFWERFWIGQFKQWGFVLENKNRGGGGPEFYFNESKNKMSNSKRGNTYKLGKKISSEAKEKISKSMKGKQNRLGYKTPQEIKDKISKTKTKKVEQYTLEGKFIRDWDSLKLINEHFNIKGYNLITRVCRGEAKSCKGYIWKYKK